MRLKQLIALSALSAACGGPDEPPQIDQPSLYGFASRYGGDDSVSYSGQVARQVLISDLASAIGGLTGRIDRGDLVVGESGSVAPQLDFYFSFDSDSYGDEPILLAAGLPTIQGTYAEISSGKDLVGKLAGNDSVTDHKDFTIEFVGWPGVESPEALVRGWFAELDANAIAHADGVQRLGPDGSVLPVHVTDDGRNLEELTQKFLTGAVSFSQGADDYLDDATKGKGILSPNTRDEEGEFTALEHAWDEGFGYFGPARDYLDYGDDLIAKTGYRDTDGDGSIDLTREFNFGASTNAAKRDLGAVSGLDLTAQAYGAFWRGRAIIAAAPEGESLDAATLDLLKVQRDLAVDAWEKAISATVVHYINETIEATETMGSDDYVFASHSEAWSEMKGFSLAFQFNPRSPVSDADFETLQELIGTAPVLDAAGADDYIAGLQQARAMLAEAYKFDDADVQAW